MYIGCDNVVLMVVEYDENLLLILLIETYKLMFNMDVDLITSGLLRVEIPKLISVMNILVISWLLMVDLLTIFYLLRG
jgi:hypothetical protein